MELVCVCDSVNSIVFELVDLPGRRCGGFEVTKSWHEFVSLLPEASATQTPTVDKPVLTLLHTIIHQDEKEPS